MNPVPFSNVPRQKVQWAEMKKTVKRCLHFAILLSPAVILCEILEPVVGVPLHRLNTNEALSTGAYCLLVALVVGLWSKYVILNWLKIEVKELFFSMGVKITLAQFIPYFLLIMGFAIVGYSFQIASKFFNIDLDIKFLVERTTFYLAGNRIVPVIWVTVQWVWVSICFGFGLNFVYGNKLPQKIRI